jgi:hypothetical protein
MKIESTDQPPITPEELETLKRLFHPDKLRLLQPLEPKDYSHLLENIPLGDWVVLSNDQERLLAHGPDLDEPFRKAKEMGEAAPFVTRVPEHVAWIPSLWQTTL